MSRRTGFNHVGCNTKKRTKIIVFEPLEGGE